MKRRANLCVRPIPIILMSIEQIQPRRKSIRLKEYDYSQAGGYFVTICTQNRECLFGHINNEIMILNEYGRIVLSCWNDLPNHYSHVRLDAFQIMPNHVHGIIFIEKSAEPVGAGFKPAPTSTKRHGLPEIVRAFKTFSARRINESRRTPGEPIWQRNYFDRIIRDENELNRILEYIIYNPLKWEEDKDNPQNWNSHPKNSLGD